ncbi:methyltransferase domain-containing protein [Halolamina salifodinae]|uniref:tRNA (Adenine57-N1/adenine58-N1)-methyltransferase n=1 Tax=Halolamina salifodinae TaxID=1202767 RepID=A0A8T4H1V2_9EURY|nr:tRNA (adenine-N1)-methyltransferase [Halolamina salifodinae]MBP1987288.1 tRNA (adenine57-N1/adenine58-N1)-methyltransferase [Halolamina salifodinae]
MGAFLLVHGDREYVRRPGEELQTDLGVLDVPEDVSHGDQLETHLGEPFSVRELRGPDLFDHFERTGAPMMPRDAGLVMGHTGAGGGDRVLDAGTGTGVLAAYLARAGAEVTTYETDEEFAEVARGNMELGGVDDRVDVRTGDVTEHLDDLVEEGPFDVLTLDTGDSPAVVERASELLASGGFIAVYSPFVESIKETVAAASGDLTDIRTFETIQRRMDVGERGTRPSTAGVGHTGYLTFARAGRSE